MKTIRGGRRRCAATGTRRHPSAGFTMIELLVVMVILGLMAAMVAPNVIRPGIKARIQTTRTQIMTLATAVNQFALDTGRYPTSQEGLAALLEAPTDVSGWNGPYLDADALPKDAWRKDFVYRAPERSGRFEILSYGADGVPGGSDDSADISSRQPG